MTDTTTPSREGFEFRGNGRDFFAIWIVNLLLSIVTLGIYSAWAKVRTKKYMHQNTYVAGHNFDYHATGGQILIGRLIIIGALIIYSLASAFAPILALLMVLFVFAIGPYLIVRSAAFNARMSSWSNVRFNFQPDSMGGAYFVYMILPILVALTLYTTFPFLTRAMQRFGINNHYLGNRRFSFDSGVGPFYKAFLISAIPAILGLFVFGSFISTIIQSSTFGGTPELGAGFFFGYVILILSFVIAAVIYQALIRNHIYAHANLGDHGFESTVQVSAMLWIAVSNAVAIICSLGLLIPWAQVRMNRYLADNTAFLANGPIEEITGEIIAEGSAIGDAYSDIEGVDLGLGI